MKSGFEAHMDAKQKAGIAIGASERAGARRVEAALSGLVRQARAA